MKYYDGSEWKSGNLASPAKDGLMSKEDKVILDSSPTESRVKDLVGIYSQTSLGGVDLNTVTEPGWYVQVGSGTIQDTSNFPEKTSGILEVILSGSTTYQIFYKSDVVMNAFYMRRFWGNVWGSWQKYTSDEGSSSLLSSGTSTVKYLWSPKTISDFVKDRISVITDEVESNREREKINVDDYGAKGNGTVDDTESIKSAINSAPSGSTIVFTPGKQYRITALVNNKNKSMHFVAYGSSILLDGDEARLSMSDTEAYSTPVAVTKLENIEKQNAVSGNGKINVVKLTLDSRSITWKRGELVRITADDVIPGTKEEGSSNPLQGRVGQTLTVISQNGNILEAAGVLDDPFTTNIKVSKYKTDVRCSWSGGTVDYTDSTLGVSNSYSFEINCLDGVVVRDVSVPRINKGAVYMRECRNWRVDNVSMGYGINDLTVNQYGYGVCNFGGYGGVMINCYFKDLRHGYINGHSSVELNKQTSHAYGRPSDNTVINCTGESTSASAFDSHSSGLREKYLNCTAKNTIDGFGLRGKNHVIDSCTVVSCYNAVSIQDDGVGGRTEGHTISNLTVENVGNIVYDSSGTRSDNSGYLKKTIVPLTIYNVSGTLYNRLFIANYSTIYISNCNIKFINSAKTTPLSLRSDIYMSNSLWDCSGSTGSGEGVRLIQMADGPSGSTAGNSVVIENMKLINVGNKLQYLVGGSNADARAKTVNIMTDSNPTQGDSQYVFKPHTLKSQSNVN